MLGVSSRADLRGAQFHWPKLVGSCVVHPVGQTVTEVADSAPGQGTEVPASTLIAVDFGIRLEARSTKRELGGARSDRCASRLLTPRRHGLRSRAPARFHGSGPGFHASIAARSPEGERSEPWRAWTEQVLPFHLKSAPFRRGWANQNLLSGRSTGLEAASVSWPRSFGRIRIRRVELDMRGSERGGSAPSKWPVPVGDWSGEVYLPSAGLRIAPEGAVGQVEIPEGPSTLDKYSHVKERSEKRSSR